VTSTIKFGNIGEMIAFIAKKVAFIAIKW